MPTNKIQSYSVANSADNLESFSDNNFHDNELDTGLNNVLNNRSNDNLAMNSEEEYPPFPLPPNNDLIPNISKNGPEEYMNEPQETLNFNYPGNLIFKYYYYVQSALSLRKK